MPKPSVSRIKIYGNSHIRGAISLSEKLSKLQQEGIFLNEEEVDITSSSWDESLSKVWSEDTSGELCATIDRLLFESPLSMAARFLEPHGFQLNLENILACIDSMRVVVQAKGSGKRREDGRVAVKKILPALYLKKPTRTSQGPLLAKFYEEVGKYESELARLQQFEAQSRKALQAAVKDETGRSAVAQLQLVNENLKEEVSRLARKVQSLNSAIQAVPMQSRDHLLPAGMRPCTVRAVKERENLVHLKGDSGQFTVPLSELPGIPVVGARALAHHEGGITRGVWIFEPVPMPFDRCVATVLHVEAGRMKVRLGNRSEEILPVGQGFTPPVRADNIILLMAGTMVIGWNPSDAQVTSDVTRRVYDEQATRQIQNGDLVGVPDVSKIEKSSRKQKRRAA